MKTKPLICLILAIHVVLLFTKAQNCGIKDPSIERHTSCPTSHSELSLKSVHWFNALNNFISTADYYFEGQGCNFGSFIAAGGIRVGYCTSCFHNGCYNAYYPGCGRAGIFLNFYDGTQDPKYKEFIGTRVDIVAGRNYTLSIDIQRSNESSTNSLGRDLAIYGYNGPIPAAQVGYCPSGAVPLDTISRALFDNDTNTTLISNFRASASYSYIFIGPVCDGNDATTTGYVYLDKILLSDANDSTLTPWIKYADKESRSCCFSGKKNEFSLVGNKASAGTVVNWGQKATNPETVVFTTPGDSFTRISGTGPFITGTYEFYYTWTKYGCSMTDTFVLNVLNAASANAGVDVVTCNTGTIHMNARSPSRSDIESHGYLTWWSLVDPTKPNGTYSFPFEAPLSSADQYCDVGPGSCSDSLSYGTNSTRWPDAAFEFGHQCDTFQFIWNVVDECNHFSSDTVKVYAYRLSIKGDSLTICPDDTSRYIYEDTDPIYNEQHRNRDSLIYTWTILEDSGAAHLVGNIHNDSIRLTGRRPGYYTVKLTVYDRTNSLCDTLFAYRTVYVRDTIRILHPVDLIICGDTGVLRIAQPKAPDGAKYWWDVVDFSQPDSLFTFSNRYFPSWPSDGNDNGHVVTPEHNDSCSAIPRDCYTIFAFPFLYPEDSFTLIYSIVDACDSNHIERDTINVRVNFVQIEGFPRLACPGDTSLYIFESSVPIHHNSRTDTTLHYSWRQVSGPAPVRFAGDTLSDSVQCIAPNVPGSYTVELDLYDVDDLECPMVNSRFSFTVLAPPSFTFSAGPDFNICNSLLVPYSFLMNASPSIATINTYGFQTWWSLVDYAQPDSEFTYLTGCFLADGFDNGNISCGFDLGCGSVNPFASDAPNCFFSVVKWGCYDFIWHLKYDCNETHLYYEDTVKVCWDFLEPGAFAGNNDTATCNVYQLNGSTSSSSAANSGCFSWRQLTDLSPSHQKISMIDSMFNISYLTGLDTITPGWYYFEYTLGCSATCNKKDTVAIYIPSSLPTPSINLTSSVASIYLCPGDSITISATGADEYKFIVNGISVTELSAISTLKYGTWLNDTNIVQVIAYDNDLGCFSSADTSLIFIVHSISVPTISSDSIIFCAGSQTYLVAFTAYNTQNIIWYSESDGFSTPINGVSGTAPGDSFMVAPIIPTRYRGIIFDTASGCFGNDSVEILVNPIVLGIPNPVAQNDTMICLLGDSISIDVHVSNSLYAGSWEQSGDNMGYLQNTTSPNTVFISSLGTYILKWSESNLGCIGEDSFQVHIMAYPEINAGEDSTICAGKFTQLNGSGNAGNYHWYPADSLISSEDLFSKTKAIYQNLLFVLEGDNGDGLCKSRDTVEIFVMDCPSDIKVPDAFSPNADGQNDFFSIFTYRMKSYQIWIFNRWGENLFYADDITETNQLNKGWDGTYKGTIQEIGTYVYLIKGINNDDENIVLKGNLSLIK